MEMTTRVRDFIKEVRVESTKVSWPSRTELRDSTIVVIATVILVTAFVYGVDWVLRFGIGLLLHS
jgi:preprotein translocase subunit SecE